MFGTSYPIRFGHVRSLLMGLIFLPKWLVLLQVIMFVLYPVHSLSSSTNNQVGNRRDQVPLLPTDPDSMIRQAASAVLAAKLLNRRQPHNSDNISIENCDLHRQSTRLPLSESMYSDKSESFVADRAIGWQGGPQETSRFLSPLVEQLLKEISVLQERKESSSTSGLTCKVQNQVLLDFDGSALLSAESLLGPKEDIIALLQPNTDNYYTKFINQMEEEFSDTPGKDKRLFLLVNPAWRNADSWGFLQAKKAQTQILNRYETTFAIDQFIMRGNKISLMKAFPHDWCLYWTPLPGPRSNSMDDFSPRLLGVFEKRPEYSEMDKLLLDALRSR